MQNDQRPGLIFVDRYMPGASTEERETAYQNVRQLVAVLVRINNRLRREAQECDSPEYDSCDRFESGSQPSV